ncbi:MAG: aldo/keto reductase [Oscillospiraceae bacterium]|nr:aldo/keto reductase [Oscillospiraceae bacterium]
MENFLGKEIAKLGFGLMRLPEKEGKTDMEQVKVMVDKFMESGFTYFDTAYVYGNGESERVAKEAIVDRYPRESFQLATKLPLFDKDESFEEIEKRFYTSLERTGAGYFDFYLIHNVAGNRRALAEKWNVWQWLQEKKAEGLVRHVGFSFHDDAKALDEILTAHPEAEFVQLQINYKDWEDSSIQSRLCYEVAMKHGVPVIIMEPVKGGTLSSLPLEAEALMKEARPEASVSSWAVRWCASLPGVITVLSGMSNTQQMEDNLGYMASFEPVSEVEQEIIAKSLDIIAKVPTVPCTKCKYCVDGCPQKINIPGILSCVNLNTIYRNREKARGEYTWVAGGERGYAKDCIGCGACENICPQHIAIIEELKKASELLD